MADVSTPPSDAQLTGELLKATNVAAPFQHAIAAATSARKQASLPTPKLVGILATPSGPSIAYAESTRKACEAVGIDFEIWNTWEDSSKDGELQAPPDFDLEADVEDLIIAANADESVHGIMVYYPIFGGRQDTYLQQIVDPRKDVEGLHFSYCFNMYHNIRWARVSELGGAPGTTSERPTQSKPLGPDVETPPPGYAKSILPCTPLAVVKCLESMGVVYDLSLPYGDRLFGKTMTIFNRSEVVGRPLAALLANDGAKVYSIDVDSIQEFNKRVETTSGKDNSADPSSSASARNRSAQVLEAHARNSTLRLRPHHVVRRCNATPEACVRVSDVVISGVPSPAFKVKTDWIKPGATVVNFSSEKNFDKDVRSRAARYLPAIGKTTIAMLQRNLLRLVEYREMADAD